jgi:Tat protein translocase TatB subunit
MGNIGGGEILVIMLLALLVLGPSKLPDAARQLGKAVAEFRKVSGGFQRELRAALEAEPQSTPAAQVPSGASTPDPSPPATTAASGSTDASDANQSGSTDPAP